MIFEPGREFAPGEVVRVSDDGNFSYRFTISGETAESTRAQQPLCDCVAPVNPPGDPSTAKGMVRRAAPSGGAFELPSDFPWIDVAVSGNPSPGYLFLAGFKQSDLALRSVPHYLVILGNDGIPVFFRKTPGPGALDFKVQSDGRLSYFQYGKDLYYLMDNTYTVCDSLWTRGYQTDIHDLQMLPNGNALIMGCDYQTVDMSKIVEGGDPSATVKGLIVQEIDVDKNVVFEWRSWDHFDILDAVGVNFAVNRIDYVHANSIELDGDGNILVSCRHMDEITKIDRDTGDIIWRMGGKNNEFTLVGDDEWFSHQHSARRIPGGTLTVFDNGNLADPRESRALEYEVDETAMTATRVWQYRNDPAIHGSAMGNVQRLPNGNTLIGWGSTNPNVTEVHPDGTKALEMTFETDTFTYRAFRYDWKGIATAPYLWTKSGERKLILYFVKFGDENVASYNVYRSDALHARTLAAKAEGNRFVVHDFEAGVPLHFCVTAVNAGGEESPLSNEIIVTPDFADVPVPAVVSIHPRTLDPKSEGKWIDARVELAGLGDVSESDVDMGSITLNGKVHADRVTLKTTGGSGGTVWLMVKFPRDRVEQVLKPAGEVEVTVSGTVGETSFKGGDHICVTAPRRIGVDEEVASGRGALVLYPNHPNPFNPTTSIGFESPAGADATVRVYDVSGRLVRSLQVPPGDGQRSVVWDGRDERGRSLPSGVYFCRLQAGDRNQTRKMLLLK